MNLRNVLYRWRKASAERAPARKKYEVIVYFNGPKTQWGGKVSDDEVIARHEMPSLALAELQLRAIVGGLNQDRCGHAILCDGEVIDSYEVAS